MPTTDCGRKDKHFLILSIGFQAARLKTWECYALLHRNEKRAIEKGAGGGVKQAATDPQKRSRAYRVA